MCCAAHFFCILCYPKQFFNYTADEFRERLLLAKYWLIYCSPENLIALNKEKNTEYYNTINEDEKKMIKFLYEGLRDNDYTLDELNVFLYSIAEKVYGTLDDKTKKAYQMKFFEIVYMLLIGRIKGPRLYLFLMAVDKNSYLELLNF
jgi:lysyl-tRNA synthetase class 1